MALQTKTFSTGDYAWQSWSNGYKIALTLTEESTDLAANTSVVSYLFTISNTDNNRFVSNDYSWTISIGGKTIQISHFNFNLSSNYTTQTIASGQVTVAHNADGSLNMPYDVSIPNVQSWTSFGPPAMALTGTWALTNIARASTIGATNADVGAVSVVIVNRKSPSFTHSVGYQFGALSGWIGADGSISNSEVRLSNTQLAFTIPESFYAQIPNAPSGICMLSCTTWSNGQQVGTPQTARFTVTASEALCRPVISVSASDINPVSLALTGDPNHFVRYVSNVQCELAATARNGASVVRTRIAGVNGSILTLYAVEKTQILFEATDSRGYTTTEALDLPLVSYINLTNNSVVDRTDPTSGNATLTIRGDWYKGSFGAVENALTLQYRINEGSWNSVTPAFGTNTYSATVQLSGLDYAEQHTVEVAVSDKVTKVSKALTVKRGIPVFDWGENDFAFNVPVHFKAATYDVAKKKLIIS